MKNILILNKLSSDMNIAVYPAYTPEIGFYAGFMPPYSFRDDL